MFKENSFQNSSTLENLDLFGINVNIRVCKKMLHQTTFGGIVSIFIFILLLLQIGLIISNILDSHNPTVLFQQTYTFQPERFNLTSDNFSLAFGVQTNTSQHFIDSSVYTMYAEFRKLTRVFNTSTNDYNINWTIKKVKTERCTSDHFQVKGTEMYFNLLKYTQLLCISKSETDLYLEGQFDSMDFSLFRIFVEQCNENSPNQKGVKCKTEQEITNALSGFRFAVYYVDYTVVTRDRDNPFQPLGKQSFWISHPFFYKSFNVLFRNSYLNTDNGLIVSSIHQQRALTFSQDKEQIGMRNGDLLLDCTLQFEKSMNSDYYRSYAKLDKALSQVGGIYQILFAIGCLLCKPLSQLELNRKLMDSLFSFVNSDDQNDKGNDDNKKGNDNDKTLRSSTKINNQNVNKSLTQINGQQTYADEQSQNFSKSKILIKKQTLTKNPSSIDDSNNINNNQNQSKRPTSQKKFNGYKKNKCGEENFKCTEKNDTNDIKFSQIVKLKTLFEKEKTMIQSVMASKNSFEMKDSVLFQFKSKDKNHNNLLMDRIKSNIIIIKEIFNQNFKELKFKTREYIISNCRAFSLCRNRKHKLLNESMDKLYQYIDIFHITTKLIEFDKLKHLLLNDEQLKLFEFIPKPIIEFGKKINIENNNQILYEDKRNIFEKTVEAQESFNKIVEKGNQMSFIDKKLIEVLHPKLKDLFYEECEEVSYNTNMPEDIDDIILQKNEVKDSSYMQHFK